MVVKFNPEGRVVMLFGRKKEASDEAEPWTRVNPPRPPIDGQFRQPTDVTWDPQGNIYISDGYINSRVAKYDRNGDWVKSFGEPGRVKPGELNTPHSIAADNRGNIYVADRGNRRIQVLNPQGNWAREIKIDVPIPPDAHPWMGNQPTAEAAANQNGAPWAICITPGPNQVLYSSDAFPGRLYKLSLDGKVLGVLGRTGRQAKQFGWIHEIACPSENEIYVAEILNWRVQKLILHPQTQQQRTAAR
jgi:DNA-binding beta-propeller fold protein YncE